MADTITVTVDSIKTRRVDASPFGIIAGQCNLSSYSSSKTALAALIGLFRTSTTLLRVIPMPLSSNGYLLKWDDTAQAFRAYQPGAVTTALAAAGSGTALTSTTSVTMNNTATVEDTLVISGGTYSAATIARGGYTSPNLSATGMIVREVGDIFSMTFTSASMPGVESLPRARVTASVAAAAAEVANATNVGTFDFIAMGQMG
jgi:hypothetical protein